MPTALVRRNFLNQLSTVEVVGRVFGGENGLTFDRDKDVDQAGMVLRRGIRKTIPVNVAFTGMEYLRKLAGHRRRFKAMGIFDLAGKQDRDEGAERGRRILEPVLQETIRRVVKEGSSLRLRSHPGMTYGDLLTVVCGRCSRTLLSPTHEPVVRAMLGSMGNAVRRCLPRAYKVQDRFRCGDCLAAESGRVAW